MEGSDLKVIDTKTLAFSGRIYYINASKVFCISEAFLLYEMLP
jgi:hypothetical protein